MKTVRKAVAYAVFALWIVCIAVVLVAVAELVKWGIGHL